jgi:hypothetical protein
MGSPDSFSLLWWDAGDEGVVIRGNGCMLFEKDLGLLGVYRFFVSAVYCHRGRWLVQRQKQIPPLRCGMTTKERATASASATTNATATADPLRG